MNQQYHWNTLYPMNKIIPPLTVKLIFDEHTRAAVSGRGAASDHYLDTTQEFHYMQPIPKPPGQAGALGRGGYSLEAHLSWQPGLYSTVQSFVRLRLKHHIDAQSLMPDRPITKQPPGAIAQVQEEVSKQFPFLSNYEGNWPTRDMISRYLSKPHSSRKHFLG